MKRKAKTVTWVIERSLHGGDIYFVGKLGTLWIPAENWRYNLRLPALKPGQSATFRVTVEVV